MYHTVHSFVQTALLEKVLCEMCCLLVRLKASCFWYANNTEVSLSLLSDILLLPWAMETTGPVPSQSPAGHRWGRLGCDNSKPWICACLLVKLLSLGCWDDSPQVRTGAIFPTPMVKGGASFPKCRGLTFLWGQLSHARVMGSVNPGSVRSEVSYPIRGDSSPRASEGQGQLSLALILEHMV